MTSNFFPDSASIPKPVPDQNNDDPIGPPTPVIQQLLGTEEMMRDLMPHLIAAGASSCNCAGSLQEMIRYLTFHTDRVTLPLDYLELDRTHKSHDHLVLGRLMEEAKRDVAREVYRWTLPHDYRTLLLAVCRSPLMYSENAFADERRKILRKAAKNGYFRDVETYNQAEYLPTKDVGFLTNNPELTLKALDQIRSVQLSSEGFKAVRNDILRLPSVQTHIKLISEDSTALIATIDQRPFSTRWVAEKMVAKQPPLMVVCMDSELILPFALMEPEFFDRWLTESDRNHRSGYKMKVRSDEIPRLELAEGDEDYEVLKAEYEQEKVDRAAMYFRWEKEMKPGDIHQICTFDEGVKARREELHTRDEEVLNDKIDDAKSKLTDAKELRGKDLIGMEFSDDDGEADEGSLKDFVKGDDEEEGSEDEEEEGEGDGEEGEGDGEEGEDEDEATDPDATDSETDPALPASTSADPQNSNSEPPISQKRKKPENPDEITNPNDSIEGYKESMKRQAAKRLKQEESEENAGDDQGENGDTPRRRRRHRVHERSVDKFQIRAAWMNDRTNDSPLRMYYLHLQKITERIEKSLPGVKVEIAPMMFLTLVICRPLVESIEFVDQLECDAKATSAQKQAEEEAEKKRAIREQQQREEIVRLTQLQKERQKKKMEGGGKKAEAGGVDEGPAKGDPAKKAAPGKKADRVKKAPIIKIPIPGTAEVDQSKRVWGNIAQMLGVKTKVKPE